MDEMILDAVTLLATNVILWLVSLYLKRTWVVDFIWSNFPIYQASAIFVRNKTEGNVERLLLTFSLLCVWGFRLTHNFYARGGIGHEDWRYADMREQFGANFWWMSLFTVFLGQTIFLFAPCLSLYGAIKSGEDLTVLDVVGAVLPRSHALVPGRQHEPPWDL